jgi:glycosyltransferase involved in cell wall biosynthesis
MPHMKSLVIYILCHNRPDDAKRAIASALTQTDQNFLLIVSDNSSNDEVEVMVRAEYPQLDYRRRVPMLPPLAHFNCCISEVQADYFCLFHDDDLMYPTFVGKMRQVLDDHLEAVACGCNARIENMGKIGTRTSFRALGRLEWIPSARELGRRYFSRAQSGIAPFPGYVYRRSAVGDIRFDEEGGKYSDVAWLLLLAAAGRMVWLNDPLMTYRIHGGNDSNTHSMRDRLRFLRFIKRHLPLLGSGMLTAYRYGFIYKPMAKNMAASETRRKIASHFICNHRLMRYLDPQLYRSVLRRALIKKVAE